MKIVSNKPADAPSISFDVQATPYDVLHHSSVKPLSEDVSGMLLWAAADQKLNIEGPLECLLDKKSSLGWKHPETGHTALHIAVQKKLKHNIDSLLKAGAPVMSLDKDNKVRVRTSLSYTPSPSHAPSSLTEPDRLLRG